MKILPNFVLAAMFTLAWGVYPGSVAQAAQPAKDAAACPSLLQHQFARLQDEAPQNLCQYAGKTILVVNTASYCGFTNQYQGLEALYAKYQKQGPPCWV